MTTRHWGEGAGRSRVHRAYWGAPQRLRITDVAVTLSAVIEMLLSLSGSSLLGIGTADVSRTAPTPPSAGSFQSPVRDLVSVTDRISRPHELPPSALCPTVLALGPEATVSFQLSGSVLRRPPANCQPSPPAIVAASSTIAAYPISPPAHTDHHLRMLLMYIPGYGDHHPLRIAAHTVSTAARRSHEPDFQTRCAALAN